MDSFLGQARKSLWIETCPYIEFFIPSKGQARKSLWIETLELTYGDTLIWVRLVRACGSKRLLE